MDIPSRTDQGKLFENRVGHLFSLLGYHVKYDQLIGGRQTDLVIEDKTGPVIRKYIVECKDQLKPVSTAQYDSFRGRLNAAKKEIDAKIQGIFVARTSFVKEVVAQSKYDEIQVITYADLEKSIIDFRQYVSDLLALLGDDPSLQYFIEPNIRRENGTLLESAIEYVFKWLIDPVANQLTLLGDFGTGKTTFLKYFALQLATNYKADVIDKGGHARVPIYIDLREYSRALSLKQLILEFLDTNSIRCASFTSFEYMLNEGYIVLIVDGFDEMASRGDQQVTLRNFRELVRAAKGRAKIVLSCRTHYFSTDQDVQRHHGLSTRLHLLGKNYTDLYREIAAKTNFLIAHIQDFSDKQVEKYIQTRCGSNAKRVSEFISETYNLPELSKRPVLLDMIVSSNDRLVGKSLTLNPSDLYDVYTDIWLSQNDWCSRLDVVTKCSLLEIFAKKIFRDKVEQCHYSEVLNLIAEWRNDISKVDAEDIDVELRTASFLVRNDEGYYRFSHKSFLEYFYARYLLKDMEFGDGSAWNGKYFTSEVYSFLRGLLQSHLDIARKLLIWVSEEHDDGYSRANAIKCLGGISLPGLSKVFIDILDNDDNERSRWCSATALSYCREDEVFQCLVRALNDDKSIFVRSNSLAAITRLNSENSISYLSNYLNSHYRMDTRVIRVLFFAALKYCDSETIINTAISQAPITAKGKETIPTILELCKVHKSQEAFDYCTKLLRSTESPSHAAIALSILPREMGVQFIGKIKDFITRYSGRPFVSELIRALAGFGDCHIASFLVKIIESGKPADSIPALSILINDNTSVFRDNALKWIQSKGTPYQIRIHAAKAYTSMDPEGAVVALERILVGSERLVVKRTALDLIHEYIPNKIESAVLSLWERAVTPGIAQYSLEMLSQVSQNSAVKLIKTCGIKANKIGVRVAACAALGSIITRESTYILTKLLKRDHSPWVRMQALRSLCVPGRPTSKMNIIAATRDEKDSRVKMLIRDLLGDQ